MTRHLIYWFAIFQILTTPFLHAESKKKQAEELKNHARDLSDIRAQDAPPFRLTVQYSTTKEDGSTTSGSYEESWVNRNQHRREITAGDNHLIEVIDGRKTWIVDGHSAPAGTFGKAASLAEFSFSTSQFTNATKVQERTVQGFAVECAIFEPNFQIGKSALCFDKNTGLLLERVYPYETNNKIVDEYCEFSDYQKFGNKMFPRSVTCFEEKRTTWTGKFELTQLTPDPAAFAPPAGAREMPHCTDSAVVAPKPTYTPDPGYPKGQGSAQHVVVLWMVIATDGKPHDVRVARSVNSAFDNAAIEAINRWTFRPATCDGQPIPVQINVEMTFRIY